MTHASAVLSRSFVALRVGFALALSISASAQATEAVVQTIDGRTLRGALSFDGAKWQVGADALAFGDAMTIRVDEGALEVAKSAPYSVWLRSGAIVPCTRIDGVAADGKPPQLRIDGASGLAIEVPLAAVAALRSRANDPQTFVADRAAPDDNLDYLYVVKDGSPQRFSVLVDKVADGTLHFDLRGSAYEFAMHGDDSVAAVVFGKNTGFAPDRTADMRVQVSLTGGEVLFGSLLAIGDGSLRMQLDEGSEARAAITKVRSIDVVSDKLLWLSAIEPSKAEQTAAFDRVRPWTKDRSPEGAGIRLRSRTYARGIVLAPRTKLTFDLGARYDVFECVAGLEERSGPLAHAIFRVYADGKLLWEATQDGAAAMPHELKLPITGCKELAIEADFGESFDLGDHCAFADVRVLKSTGASK